MKNFLYTLPLLIALGACSCGKVASEHARELNRGLQLLQKATTVKPHPSEDAAMFQARSDAVASLWSSTLMHCYELERLADK